MGYSQLTLNERIEIYRLHAGGISLRRISALLGRSAGTISREIRRNSQVTKAWSGGYEPVRAEALAQRRRHWDCRYKLARQPALREHVRKHLAMGWSPEQIAGRLTLEQGKPIVSHESIYRFIYHRSAQKDYWHRLLPRKKSRRGRLARGGRSAVDTMKRRMSIHDRPACIHERAEYGHWEGDLMLFRQHSQAALVVHERYSRKLEIIRQPGKTAQPVADNLKNFFAALPPPLRQSITFDNGPEFTLHYQLIDSLTMQTYFCDPHKPWQKGGVENAIGRMRRKLPRNTDLAAMTSEVLHHIMENYNDTPRKCLEFLTPNEVFNKALSTVALQT